MYQVKIRVKGKLDAEWSEWFGGLAVDHILAQDTVLTGQVVDQTALFGILTKVRDLGLQLVSVEVADISRGKVTNESAIG